MGTVTAHTRSTPPDGNRCDRGASLVEFALIAPLLFAILLGTITAGLALSAKNSMTNAVREGGRLGATLEIDAATWGTKVKNRVVALSGGDVDENQICAEIRRVGEATTLAKWPTSGPCPAAVESVRPDNAGAAAGTCLIKVWAKREADLNALFFTRGLSLEAKVVGVYEGTCA